MNPVSIIQIKKRGGELTKKQLKHFIEGYLAGEVADYQMSAFLMAVYFKGMTTAETFALTETMLESGEVIDLSFINKPKIDKHSTGGVGDKTSLILAAQVASYGIAVPMISGRGLGHTGGTLDKLESIPGFNINYSTEEYKKIISDIDAVLIGQTPELAPADKRIYSLRDVTGTVDSVPLITASIMSKKLAEGAEGLVFDVKMGTGANLADKELSRKLSENLLAVSGSFDKKAVCVLTDMDEPLGYKIGNWLEVEECLQVMEGEVIEDLLEVNDTLAGAMIMLGGKAESVEEGKAMAKESLMNGKALDKFYEIVERQEGSVDYLKDWKNEKRAKYKHEIRSESDGYIKKLDALSFGLAAVELECGRKKTTDKIDHLAGIILKKKRGDEVKKGEVICELYSSTEKWFEHAEKLIKSGIYTTPDKQFKKSKILEIMYQK